MNAASGRGFPSGAAAKKRKAASRRGLSAAGNVAFHKMLVAATRRFTPVNRVDCFMNLRFQYRRCGKVRETELL
jgi:hypothetical protein